MGAGGDWGDGAPTKINGKSVQGWGDESNRESWLQRLFGGRKPTSQGWGNDGLPNQSYAATKKSGGQQIR